MLHKPQGEERVSQSPMMQDRIDRIRNELGKDIGIGSIRTFLKYFHEADKAFVALGSRAYEDFELFENLGMTKQMFGLRFNHPSQICAEYVLTHSGRLLREILVGDVYFGDLFCPNIKGGRPKTEGSQKTEG